MMDKETKRKKEKLKKDLHFYLDYYKEIAGRSEKMKETFDREIERLIEELKEIGK